MTCADLCSPKTLPHHACRIHFAGQEWWLDPSGALFWPAEKMLLLADLHFEKGSFLARAGSSLPAYDTRETLRRIAALLDRYHPREVMCLGDSFHDHHALMRLQSEDAEHLQSLILRVSTWHWIRGNHDPALPPSLPGEHRTLVMRGNICLRHEPEEGDIPQIIGHFHPKARLRLGGVRVSGPCLLHDEQLMMMPAFGSYTGGLDKNDPAITGLFQQSPSCHLLYRGKAWKI